jgi:hypothetical protein
MIRMVEDAAIWTFDALVAHPSLVALLFGGVCLGHYLDYRAKSVRPR